MSINFFTPICFKTEEHTIIQHIVEKLEDLFYLGGEKAYVSDNTAYLIKDDISLTEKIIKVACYFFLNVIPLVLLGAKALLRVFYSYPVFDPKGELEKGIEITEELKDRLHKFTSVNFKSDEIKSIKDDRAKIFQFKDTPALIFKVSRDSRYIEERFKNVIEAVNICFLERLNLLVIPHAKLVKLDNSVVVIVEEMLEVNSNPYIQLEYYDTCAPQLDETIGQLTRFILKFGFADVALRNIPLILSSSKPKVALYDLESREKSPLDGIVGSYLNTSVGLIGCVAEKSFEVIIREVKKYDPHFSDIELKNAQERRLKRIKEEQEIRAFHSSKGFTRGDEPLEDVNLDPRLDDKVVQEVINLINLKLSKSSPNSSIMGRRNVYLPFYVGPLEPYRTLGSAKHDDPNNCIFSIINALIQNRYIYSIVENHHNGILLQA